MNSRWSRSVVAAAIVLALSTPAMAQFDGPPPGGFGGGVHGGPGGPGGPGGFGGGPGGPGARSLTVAEVPVHVLAIELNLTDDQKSKIESTEKDIQSQRRDLFGSPGERPDPDQMQANFEKMRALDKSAQAKVEAILTSDQQAEVKPLLKSLGTLRPVDIPIELYSDLKLTDDQKSDIADLAASNRKAMQAAFSQGRDGGFDQVRTAMDNVRTKTDAKLKTILTEKQYDLIEAYRQKHPRRTFGGPGGPGGGNMPPPPGGFGGGVGGPGADNGGGPGRQWARNGQDGPGGPAPEDDVMGPPPGVGFGGPGGDDGPPPPGSYNKQTGIGAAADRRPPLCG